MNKFLERKKLPKPSQEKTENLNRSTGKRFNSFPKEKPGPDCLTGEFYKTFKGKLRPILHRLFSQNGRGNTVQLTLRQHYPETKSDKDITYTHTKKTTAQYSYDYKH